jgi:hypothetical protein
LRQLRNPLGDEINGSKCRARHDGDFRTRSSNGDDSGSGFRSICSVIEGKQDSAALDPEQMMSGARTAFGKAGGEYINVTVRDLEHVLTVVEESRLSGIEREACRFENRRLIGSILRGGTGTGIVHSWPTSFA